LNSQNKGLKFFIFFLLQYVDPPRVVHEAEVEHGRALEVLRAARLHLRPAQGDEAAFRRITLLSAKTLLD